MARRLVITGLGALSGLGIGIEPTWKGLLEGRSGIGPIRAFDASAFGCRIASELKDFKVQNHVPKSYRKAIKVMARDIELAVAAADLAARDAKLATRATLPDENAKPDYDPPRVGCHVGAGLIAVELNELTEALTQARKESGEFDILKWGNQGMQ